MLTKLKLDGKEALMTDAIAERYDCLTMMMDALWS